MLKRIGSQMAGRRLRGLAERVFVNNQIDLSRISTFGFDYDYTLAEYKGEQSLKDIFFICEVKFSSHAKVHLRHSKKPSCKQIWLSN